MTWQLATAKIYNGSTWVNATGGADIYAATDGNPDVPTFTSNVTVAASGTAHTKGAWIEVIASTGFAANRITFQFGANQVTNTNSSALLDVGFGAAGSEVVKVANIAVGYSNGGSIDIPLLIPSGTRIALRMQSASAGKTMTAQACIARTAKTLTVDPSGAASTFGANATTSQGVTFTSGNGSKGSWVQVTADSGLASKWAHISIQGNGNNNWQAYNFTVDIGIGAAGAETVIIPNIRVSTTTSEVVTWTSAYRQYFVSIPANSRIAVRSQSTGLYSLDIVVATIAEVGSL